MKPPEDKHERKTLSIPEAAELINVPSATVWHAVKTGVLPSYKRGRAIYIARRDVLQVAAQLQRRDTAPAKAVAGELAGECFERFTQGQDPVTIVRELRQDPAVVDRLWDQWRALKEKFLQTRPAPCVLAHKGPCSGPPSLNAMLCAGHAEHATVLTENEELALRVSTEGVLDALMFAVEGEALVVRTGGQVRHVAITSLGLTHKAKPYQVGGAEAQNMIDKARQELGIK